MCDHNENVPLRDKPVRPKHAQLEGYTAALSAQYQVRALSPDVESTSLKEEVKSKKL